MIAMKKYLEENVTSSTPSLSQFRENFPLIHPSVAGLLQGWNLPLILEHVRASVVDSCIYLEPPGFPQSSIWAQDCINTNLVEQSKV